MRKRHANPYKEIANEAFAQGAPQKRFFSKNEEIERIPVLIRSIPIMWGIPCDEVMYSKFFTAFFRSANLMPWDALATTESTYLPDARNQIHKAFVEKSDMPYLLMVDSDIMMPPHTAEILLSHNLPIVAGWYRNKHPMMAHHPVVYDFVSENEGAINWRPRQEPGKGLEKIGGVGAGCILMSRAVAESLGPKPYDMNRGTEDLVLCRKLMNLGIDLYVDWNVNCAHIGVSWV